MPSFDKSKPLPAWLTRKHENKNTQRGQRYYIKMYNAQPTWANRKAIDAIYADARYMRRVLKLNVHVDHIYPLCSPLICGLHIAINLRIVSAFDNMKKSNYEWPGHEQLDFFKPEFFELETQ